MVSKMDDTTGQIARALIEEGMWSDTLFIFASDVSETHYGLKPCYYKLFNN